MCVVSPAIPTSCAPIPGDCCITIHPHPPLCFGRAAPRTELTSSGGLLLPSENTFQLLPSGEEEAESGWTCYVLARLVPDLRKTEWLPVVPDVPPHSVSILQISEGVATTYVLRLVTQESFARSHALFIPLLEIKRLNLC